MDDARLAAACGIYCGGCEHLEVRCTGCGGVEGKPFWTSEMKQALRRRREIGTEKWLEDQAKAT